MPATTRCTGQNSSAQRQQGSNAACRDDSKTANPLPERRAMEKGGTIHKINRAASSGVLLHMALEVHFDALGHEALAAKATTTAEDVTTVFSLHAGTKTKLLLAGALGWLVSSFWHSERRSIEVGTRLATGLWEGGAKTTRRIRLVKCPLSGDGANLLRTTNDSAGSIVEMQDQMSFFVDIKAVAVDGVTFEAHFNALAQHQA